MRCFVRGALFVYALAAGAVHRDPVLGRVHARYQSGGRFHGVPPAVRGLRRPQGLVDVVLYRKMKDGSHGPRGRILPFPCCGLRDRT